jgi:hypothetical protein
MEQETTLNIPYNMHEEDWFELRKVYVSMPGWIGFESEDCAYWFGKTEDEMHIEASVEPSGLVLSGFMEDRVWGKWIEEFIQKSSLALEYEVKEIGNHY